MRLTVKKIRAAQSRSSIEHGYCRRKKASWAKAHCNCAVRMKATDIHEDTAMTAPKCHAIILNGPFPCTTLATLVAGMVLITRLRVTGYKDGKLELKGERVHLMGPTVFNSNAN